jgi:sulfatase modifying factor 1
MDLLPRRRRAVPCETPKQIVIMTTKSKTLWLLLAASVAAQAAPPVTVTVGKPGNAADSTGYGAVAYEYKIGKFEVTNEEYCAFLNGAAKSDSYELYDGRMGDQYGGILRSGESGSFTYSVKDGMGKKPVNFVNYDSCVRFCNWLTSGDTEKGSYTIKWGQVTPPNHATIAAEKTVKWVIPTENEWYKAAYFDAAKPGGAGYWSYAVKGGSAPECNLNTDTPTDAGKFASAASPCGTFDQNGNVWEYSEGMSDGKVGLRGGSFYMNDNDSYLQSGTRYDVYAAKWPNYGFRVAALGGGEAAAEAKDAKKETAPKSK